MSVWWSAVCACIGAWTGSRDDVTLSRPPPVVFRVSQWTDGNVKLCHPTSILSESTMFTASPIAVTRVRFDTNFDLPGIAFCAAPGDESHPWIVGSSDTQLYRVDISSEKPKAEPIPDSKHISYVTGVVRSGDTVISGGYDRHLVWRQAESGEVRQRVENAHASWIRELSLSPDGQTLATVGDDMLTCLWSVADGKKTEEYKGYDLKTPHSYPSMLYTVAWSPDGKFLATGNKTGQVLIRDSSSGEVAAKLETPVMYTWDPKARRHSIGGIRSLAFSPDGQMLAVGGMGKVGNIDHLGGKSRVEVFDWQKNERRFEIEDDKFKGLAEKLQFGPDGSWLAIGGGDHGGFVSIYNMSDGKVLAQEKAPMHIHDLWLQPDGVSVVAVGHGKGTIASLADKSPEE